MKSRLTKKIFITTLALLQIAASPAYANSCGEKLEEASGLSAVDLKDEANAQFSHLLETLMREAGQNRQTSNQQAASDEGVEKLLSDFKEQELVLPTLKDFSKYDMRQTPEYKRKAEVFQKLAIDHQVLFGLMHMRSLSRVFRKYIANESSHKGVGGQQLNERQASVKLKEFMDNPAFHTDENLGELAKLTFDRLRRRYNIYIDDESKQRKITGYAYLESVKGMPAAKGERLKKETEALKFIAEEAAHYDMTAQEFIDAGQVVSSIEKDSETEKIAIEIIKETLLSFLPIAFTERTEVGDKVGTIEVSETKNSAATKTSAYIGTGLGVASAVAAHFLGFGFLADAAAMLIPPALSSGGTYIARNVKQKIEKNKTLKARTKSRWQMQDFRESLVDEDGVYKPRDIRNTTPLTDEELARAKSKRVKVDENYLAGVVPTKIDPNVLATIMAFGSEFDIISSALRREVVAIHSISLSESVWADFIKANSRIIQEIKSNGSSSIDDVNLLVEPLADRRSFLAIQFDELGKIERLASIAIDKIDQFIESANHQKLSFTNVSPDVEMQINRLSLLRLSLSKDKLFIQDMRGLINEKSKNIGIFLLATSAYRKPVYGSDSLDLFTTMYRVLMAGSDLQNLLKEIK